MQIMTKQNLSPSLHSTRQYAIRGQVGGDHGGVAPLGQSVLPAELPRHELVVRLLLVLGLHAQRVAHHAHLSST